MLRGDQMYRAAGAVIGGWATVGVFRADEIGQQIEIIPTRTVPSGKIAGVAPDMGHGVETSGTADDFAARPSMNAAGAMLLRRGGELPIDIRAL